MSENPEFIVNGFVKSGMSGAMDGFFEEVEPTHGVNDEIESVSDFNFETDDEPEQ